MGASDAIRAGQLKKFKALESAGLTAVTVAAYKFVSITGGKTFAGVQGAKTYKKYNLKPNPEVTFRLSESPSQMGLEKRSDVILTGAFPEGLSGYEVSVAANGTETTGSAFSEDLADWKAFRDLVTSADYFVIDGTRYKFRNSSGYMDIDRHQSYWKVALVKETS